MMTIGEKIKQTRKEKRLTQKQLGSLCKPPISESTIRKYELGLLNPKMETIKKIAEALDMYIFDFLDDDYFDIATDEEPGCEENEIKFLKEKTDAIRDILRNRDISDKDKKNILHNHILQTEIIANMHLEDAKRGDMHLFEICYDTLNDEGRDKARELLIMLTKIPEYQKEHVALMAGTAAVKKDIELLAKNGVIVNDIKLDEESTILFTSRQDALDYLTQNHAVALNNDFNRMSDAELIDLAQKLQSRYFEG